MVRVVETLQGPLHFPLVSPEQLVAWVGTLIIYLLLLYTTCTFVASNSHCTSLFQTNSYSIDKAVALKE